MSPRRLISRRFWARHRVLISIFIAWVGIGVALVGVYEISHTAASASREVKIQAALGARTYHAVCDLQQDYQRRVDDGKAFLEAHPEGIPGISGKTIRASLANEEKTIKALSALRCPN